MVGWPGTTDFVSLTMHGSWIPWQKKRRHKTKKGNGSGRKDQWRFQFKHGHVSGEGTIPDATQDETREEMVHRHNLELRKLAGEWRAMADYLTINAVEGRGVSRASLDTLADSANASVRTLRQLQSDSKAMESLAKKCQCNPDIPLQNGCT